MSSGQALESMRLSPDELRLAGLQLFGAQPGWQSSLARNLGVDRSSVTRWLSGAVQAPLWASLLVRYMLVYGIPEDAEIKQAPLHS